ncbi:MAG: methionyl-tRNA formyltransferase [Candidatus Wildermuthbacteria bacterium]|nr:methionyl-tRNA formyltransferase [Candidatus Wildermuthbacteria bacterium]
MVDMVRVVFFGTSEFGARILRKLIAGGYSPALVVTAPDALVGRKQTLTPPPVKSVALEHDIAVYQPEKLGIEAVARIQEVRPDILLLAAYGKIIPGALLQVAPRGALNAHPSLLPKFRGPSPIQYAIFLGEEKTGVSIMEMDEEIDHGPVIIQRECLMESDQFKLGKGRPLYPELHDRLADIGGDLLVEILPGWISGTLRAIPQKHGLATFTKKIEKEDGRIDWTKDALYIERRMRAFFPWPGIYTLLEGKIIKILNAHVEVLEGGHPGAILPFQNSFAVACGKDALVIEELQAEGGKPMSAREFLLGHKDIMGKVLE